MTLQPFDKWVDPEMLVINGLSSQLAGVQVRNETGTSWSPPLVRVTLTPGGSGDLVEAVHVVDVESFAANRAAMWALAWRVHAAMLRLPELATKGGEVDRVRATAWPGYVDYDNPNVRRAIGTYELTSRVQATL